MAHRVGAATGGSAPLGSVIERLSSLQNLIKRDPESYAEEFRLQHRNFLAELEILRLQPSTNAESFKALTNFLAAVAPCFPAALAGFPAQLIALLEERAAGLAPDVRRTLVQALMLLRNRGVVASLPLLRVFFGLFRVHDKPLRALVAAHIVADVRRLNGESGGKRDDAASRGVQAALYALAGDADAGTAKRALDVLMELYRRRLWTDARTINVIAAATLSSPRTKLLVAGLRFFLGLGDDVAAADAAAAAAAESSDDDDGGDGARKGGAKKEGAPGVELDAKALREARGLHAHSKRTRRHDRQTERAVKNLKKAGAGRGGAGKGGPVWPAIQLLHDPQGLAEKVFAGLRGSRERFEVRLMQMNLVSRLIGTHKLLLLPFYSFVQRYLGAHTSHVTQVLAYLIQACHDLVPPDEVVPVIRAIANAFVADRCPPEVVTVGLNAMREVIAHVPVVLEEPAMADMLPDLLAYRKSRSRSVAASARSLLNLMRDLYPAMLKRRDWGRALATDGTGAADARPTAYGATRLATGVEGADLLALALARGRDAAAAPPAGAGGARAPRAKTPRARAAAAAAAGAAAESDAAAAVRALLADIEDGVDDDDDDGDDEGVGGADGSGDASGSDVIEGDDSDEDGGGDSDEDDDDDADDAVVGGDGAMVGDDDSDDDDDGDDEEEEVDGDGSDVEVAAAAAVPSRKRRRVVGATPGAAAVDDARAPTAASAPGAAGRKRARAAEDASSAAGSAAARIGGAAPRSVLPPGASSGGRSGRHAALAAAAAAASSAQLEGTRLLTGADFARIRRLRAALAERGGAALPPGATLADVVARVAGVAEPEPTVDELVGGRGGRGAGGAKRRRGARPGYDEALAADEAAEDAAADAAGGGRAEGPNLLAMPGTTFAPPVAAMDPSWLEGDDTRKKRQAAQRLLEALDEKAAGAGAKFFGRKPGGGMTNKEKRRFKNFGMLRKSTDVQAKVRRTLASTQKALRARRTGLKVMDTRKKQRRRRA